MDAWRHHIARRRAAGIEAVLRQPSADHVAVGHHSDQPVVLSDRNGAYIMLTHQFREFCPATCVIIFGDLIVQLACPERVWP